MSTTACMPPASSIKDGGQPAPLSALPNGLYRIKTCRERGGRCLVVLGPGWRPASTGGGPHPQRRGFTGWLRRERSALPRSTGWRLHGPGRELVRAEHDGRERVVRRREQWPGWLIALQDPLRLVSLEQRIERGGNWRPRRGSALERIPEASGGDPSRLVRARRREARQGTTALDPKRQSRD